MDSKRERPTSVLVFGILYMVFGGLGVFYNLCCCTVLAGWVGLGPALLQNPGFKRGFDEAAQGNPDAAAQIALLRDPVVTTTMLTQLGLGLFVAVAQLTSGIGLFRMRPWARVLALATAVGLLLLAALNIGLQLVVLTPAHDAALARQMQNAPPMPFDPRAINRASELAGVLVGALPQSVLAVAALVLLSRRNVRDALSGTGPASPRPAPWPDDEDF